MSALSKFIKQRPYLFWHTRNLEKLSSKAVVEGVLNYGDFQDVKKLFSILGTRQVASIFHKQIKKRRSNYRPEIENYFKLYFQKNA